MADRFEVERVPNSEAEALRRGPTGDQLFWRLGEAWRVVPSSTEPDAHARALAVLLYEDQNPTGLKPHVWEDIPPAYREAWVVRAKSLLDLVTRAAVSTTPEGQR
jgi:hypothetical protein